jgi:hypothetical protein
MDAAGAAKVILAKASVSARLFRNRALAPEVENLGKTFLRSTVFGHGILLPAGSWAN